ncbi:MAG: S8 family serine peptidase [Nanoarchaeota archaeon]
MVYKKFIKRDGKVYGPYLYKSVKKDGRVTTHYLGPHDSHHEYKETKNFFGSAKKPSKKFWLVTGFLSLIIILLTINLIFLINLNFTGKVSVELKDNYVSGEDISGNINLILKQGELIPADSKLIIDNAGSVSNYNLRDLIFNNLNQGNFFVEGKDINGTGQGFGVLGKKEVYPLVNFKFKVVKEKEIVVDVVKNESVNNTGAENVTLDIPSTTPVETPSTTPETTPAPITPDSTTTETPATAESSSPTPATETPTTPAPSSSEVTTDSSSSGSGLTGEAVGAEIIEGQVSKNQPYNYELKKNEVVEIVESDQQVSVSYQNGNAIIITDYSKFEEGFGSDYLTNEIIKLPIDLSSLNLKANQGALKVSFVYNDVEITSSSVDIKVEEISLNITNITNITEIPLNETNVTSNLTKVERINKIISEKGINIDSKVLDDLQIKNKVRVIIKNKGVAVGQKLNGFNDLEVLELDEQNLALLQNVEIVVDQPVSLLLTESEKIIRSIDVKNQFGLTGNGKKVCVIDTGVDSSVVGYTTGFDFVNNDSDASDDNGHGTEVAYILKTIASGADVYVAKVLDATGNGYESNVLEGLQWCMNQNVDIISLSIGAGSYAGFCDTNIVAEFANSAVDNGIFVIAATGNDGSTSLKSPSCASKVVRVSATDKSDNIANFANMNEAVDVLAPGVNILTKSLGNSDKIVSGTSASTPMVAAGAAIVLQNETLLPLELKNRFKTTGKPIEYAGSVTINISRLDVYGAVTNNITLGLGNYTLNQTNVTNQSNYSGLGIEKYNDSTYIYYRTNDTGTWSISYNTWTLLGGSFNITEQVITVPEIRANFSKQQSGSGPFTLGAYSSCSIPGSTVGLSGSTGFPGPVYVVSSWATAPNSLSSNSNHSFCATGSSSPDYFYIEWAELRFKGGNCDDSQSVCTGYAQCDIGPNSYGSWLSGATGANTLCCGDDSGETWNGSSLGCCCNAGAIATSTSNGVCQSNNRWCYYNATTTKKDYCTASSLYFQGNSTNNTMICGGVCSNTERTLNYICDSNSDGNIDGICGSDGVSPACIGPVVFVNPSGIYYPLSVASAGTPSTCDSNVSTEGGFIAEGVITYNLSSSQRICDNSGNACYNNVPYRSDCSACSSLTSDVDACDANVVDGSYTAQGYCTSGGVCATGSVYNNSGTLVSGCTNGGGQACDSNVIGSENGAWSQYADGICVAGSTCDTNLACKNQTDVYQGLCSLCAKNDVCDNNVDNSGFIQDGYCAINDILDSACCSTQDSCSLSNTCYANRSFSPNNNFYCQFGNWNQIDIYNNSGCAPTLPGVNRWIVNGSASCSNVIINVASLNITNGGNLVLNNVTLVVGNTTINSGGSFTIRNSPTTIWQNSNLTISGVYVLDNSTLRMNGTSDGYLGIKVISTGNMVINNSANITNGDNINAHYFFVVNSGALFNMSSSYLSYAGWSQSVNNVGLIVYASNAVVYNSTFRNNYRAISLYGGTKSNITFNNIFTNSSVFPQANGYGIDIDFSNNNLVYSNQIETFGPSDYGIRVYNIAQNNNISSNNITTHGQSSYGFFGYIASSNIFSNNNITTEALLSIGVYLFDNTNLNQIFNNNIKTSGNNGTGIKIEFNNPQNNNITSNKITTFGTNSSGIEISFASNNLFSYNNITTSNISSIGIYLNSNSTLNSFYNDRINSQVYSINLLGGVDPTRNNTFTNVQIINLSSQIYSDSNAYSNILLNSTFNESRITFGATGTNNLTIKWYVRVNVSDFNNQSIQGASVNITDVNNILEFSQTTDLQGLTSWNPVIDKIKRLSGDVLYNNHTINVSKTGYFPKGLSRNLTNTTQIDVTLSYISNVNYVILEPFTAYTSDNLNCTFNISNPSPNTNVSVYWYRNSQNILNQTIANYASGTNYTAVLNRDYSYHDNSVYCNVGGEGFDFAYRNSSNSITIQNFTTSISTTQSAAVIGQQVIFTSNYSSGMIGDVKRLLWNTSDFDNGAYASPIVRIFDSDNDGKTDALVTANSSSVVAYRQNGSILWAYDLFYEKRGIRIADVDGDNMSEIIVITQDGLIVILNNNGVLKKNIDLNSISTSPSLYSLEIGDINGDKINDIVVAGHSLDSTPNLFAYNGTGKQLWNNSDYLGSIYWNLEFVDANFDGKIEYVIVASLSKLIVFNSSTGQFIRDLTLLSGNTIIDLVAGDFNNDGIADIATASQNTNNERAYAINISNNIILWSTYLSNYQNNGYEIVASDINNDGKKDIVLGWNTEIRGIDNSGSPIWNFSKAKNETTSLSAKDISDDIAEEIIAGDENQIVYVLDKTTGNLRWLYNLNKGSIGSVNGKSEGIDVGDINQDGINDIVAASSQGYLHVFQDVSCKIAFNDSVSGDMTWNASTGLWNYNRTFTIVGNYTYNTTCEKGGYQTKVNTSSVFIGNTLPTVNLYSPLNNSNLTNRTPTLIWNGTDADGKSDIKAYELNISCYYYTGGLTSLDSRLITITSGSPVQENYAVTTPLKCLVDNGYYYTWKVRANDTVGFGAWSDEWRFNVSSVIDINLTNRLINFGSMLPNDNNDTSDDSPWPFKLENIGNSLVNVSINATNLWITQPNPSGYFQYKFDNRSEPGSFNWSSSQITWKNVPTQGEVKDVLSRLNWQDANDVAEIDINVTVPGAQEGTGVRSSIINFTASLAE